MNQLTWNAVDTYFTDVLVSSDTALEKAIADSQTAGLPPHHVSPNQGKLLQLLAQMQGAEKILEIGTLGGYSTIWLARAVPSNGCVVTLEANPDYAEIAVKNITRANLSHIVDVRVGKAIETLPQLWKEDLAPFDFIFIDADKPSNPEYLQWSLKLSRPGTVIIGDNVVRNGEVINPNSLDARVQGVRQFCELLAAEPKVSATAIQTVGSKGYDGFTIARVMGEL
ncbi:MAG: O-methyltransferase [Leptolyngbya sp. SIO1D8]|nr:O-methyltransferase [Leptolyngbya sp. SIO1D8]